MNVYLNGLSFTCSQQLKITSGYTVGAMMQTIVKLEGKHLSFPVSYLLDRAIHTIQRTCCIICAATKCPLALHL